MDENDAKSVILIRAIENSDPAYEILTQSDREFATREAGRSTSGSRIRYSGIPGSLSRNERERPSNSSLTYEEDFFIRRARFLQERLIRKFPRVADASTFSVAAVVFSIAIAAFLLGVATNALGESKRVNIIAFPLMGMLAWNIGIYLLLIVERFRRGGTAVSHRLRRAVMALMLPSRILKSRQMPAALAEGIRRYHDDWTRLAAPLYSMRAKYALHLAAALLALGAVAGMYLRGIGFEYLAGWESTFLSERNLRPLLDFVLGPASLLTGIGLPDERQLAELRWSTTQAGENAARWIHLWAATAIVVIVAPRIVLSAVALRKGKALASNFRLPDEPYFRRLLPGARGERIRLVPYGYEPSNEVRDNIRKSLARVLGEGTRVEFENGVAYGAEEDYLSAASREKDALPDRLIVLFTLAATPEPENHEFLLASLQRLVGQNRAAQHLLAFVDESSFRARFAKDSARMDERRAAWRALLLPYAHAFADFSAPDLAALEPLFVLKE